MNEKGNHGGCTPGETAAALLFASPSLPAINQTRIQAPVQPRGGRYLYYDVVQQADLVPTLSGLLGLPTPRKNVGVFIPAFLGLWPEEERLEVLKGNEAQLKRLHELNSLDGAERTPPSDRYNNTVTDETDAHRLLEVSFSISATEISHSMVLATNQRKPDLQTVPESSDPGIREPAASPDDWRSFQHTTCSWISHACHQVPSRSNNHILAACNWDPWFLRVCTRFGSCRRTRDLAVRRFVDYSV